MQLSVLLQLKNLFRIFNPVGSLDALKFQKIKTKDRNAIHQDIFTSYRLALIKAKQCIFLQNIHSFQEWLCN
jgi:hypothetical protein